MSTASREKKRQHVKRRVAAPPIEGQCIVLRCGRKTQRALAKGLSSNYCKRCKEKLRRHGVTWRKSYSMTELRPYFKAATDWTKAHKERDELDHTIKCLEIFLEAQGEPVDGWELAGLKPKLKARSALASFREAKGNRARELFIIALALEAITEHEGPRGKNWRHIQIAKRVHRVGAGTHKVTSTGIKLKGKWPKAEGKKMRLIGEWVRKEARVFELEGAVEETIKAATG